MKLSVIVPVYNVEPYLEKCLDSLLDQGLVPGEYEILCVDDGSTDKSGAIADRYGAFFPQLRVLHQENGGLSAARNAGIREASGEYLYFADSDDFLERGVLGKLCEVAVKHGLDKLMFDYLPFEDGTEPVPDTRGTMEPVFFQTALKMQASPLTPAWTPAWNYLVRTDILREYGLRFFPGLLFEDKEFSFWLDRCAGKSGYIDRKLYYYRRRSTSILGTFRDKDHFPAYIQGRIRLAAHYQALLAGEGPPCSPRIPLTAPELEIRQIDEIQGILNNLIFQGDQALFREVLQQLKAEGLYPYPIRWKRLFRKKHPARWLTDLAAFPLPLEGYLRFCMGARCLLGGRAG